MDSGRARPADDPEIAKIARAWLRYLRTKQESDWWAAEAVMDAVTDADSGDLSGPLRIMLALTELVDREDHARISDIGAGPVESLVMKFGDEALDLIEAELPHNPTLREAFGSVWAWNEPVRPRFDRLLEDHGIQPS